jgi:hypothetical protein
MSTDNELEEKPPVSLWRRLLSIGGVFMVVMIVLGASRWMYERHRSAARVDQMIAALDESDPGWKIEDLEASRIAPPEAENSARVILAVKKLLPSNWSLLDFDRKVQDLLPPELIEAAVRQELADELKKGERAVTMARRLADMPRGKHTLEIASNPLATLLLGQQEARTSAWLLQFDAWNLALDRDIKGAMRSSRGIINAARSLDDEPFYISLLIRIACVSIGTGSFERCLALGEATDADLVEAQQLLTLEEKHPTMLICVRGERALMHTVMDGLASGRIPSRQMFGADLRDLPNATWRDRFFGMSRSEIRRQHATMLEFMTRMVELSKLPTHEQRVEESKIDVEMDSMSRKNRLAALLLSSSTKMNQACRRKLGVVRSMQTLLACERYRLKHGKWPDKLDDLTPAFLDRVPLDPVDGKPIRYKKLPDGVMVYVVGDDGIDNGGNLPRRGSSWGGADIDVGYQLWDVSKRRQPAPPTPRRPEDEAGGPGGPGDP